MSPANGPSTYPGGPITETKPRSSWRKFESVHPRSCRGCGGTIYEGRVYRGPGFLYSPYLCGNCWADGGPAIEFTNAY